MTHATPTDLAPDRTIWSVTGADAVDFLQGIVTNDLLPLSRAPGLVWAALLTPQGKYMADFFVARLADAPPDTLLVDIATALAPATLARLMMYRLRAKVTIAPVDLLALRGLGPPPPDALPDPRHPALGWRAWRGEAPVTRAAIDWDAIRVAHCIPDSAIELVPNDTYILEAGFERLHGVDFRKGCYVGQEVTARMKHKTDLRKGLVQVLLDGPAPVGTPILSGDKPVGTLFSQSGGRAIAYLRQDRAAGPMTAGEAIVRLPTA